MNEIVNKFLLAGDKFLPEMHLRHLQQMFVDHLLKIKRKFKNLKKQTKRNLRYVYQIELNKAYFQHNMCYGDFKELPRITAFHKVLREKAFNIAKSLNKIW